MLYSRFRGIGSKESAKQPDVHSRAASKNNRRKAQKAFRKKKKNILRGKQRDLRKEDEW